MEKSNKKPVVLTCDPSFTAWGWAVLQGNLVIEHGCIQTKPEAKKRRIREGDDRVRRTSELIKALLDVIDNHKITFIVSELPHGSQNAKAAVTMGVVLAVVQTLSDALEIPVEWYSEADAKKAVVGRISASKREIQDAIDQLYEVKWQFKPNGKPLEYYNEAVADALAIYFAAESNSPTLKFLNK